MNEITERNAGCVSYSLLALMPMMYSPVMYTVCSTL